MVNEIIIGASLSEPQSYHVYGGGRVLLWMDDNDVSSACDRGSTWMGSPIALPLASYVAISGWGYTSIMRALQVDRLQRRRDLAAAETGEDREAQ